MRIHLSIALAAALAAASFSSVTAGTLVDPAVESEPAVAPEAPASSMGGLGIGLGVLLLLGLAASGGSSSGT